MKIDEIAQLKADLKEVQESMAIMLQNAKDAKDRELNHRFNV